jgi:hypothetical protein
MRPLQVFRRCRSAEQESVANLERAGLQVEVVGLGVCGGETREPRTLGNVEIEVQRHNDRLGGSALKLGQLRGLAVVATCPAPPAGRDLEQLDVQLHIISNALHATTKYCVRLQLLRDPTPRLALHLTGHLRPRLPRALVRIRREHGRDGDSTQPRELSGDCVGQAECKILVLLVLAQVFEWQYGDDACLSRRFRAVSTQQPCTQRDARQDARECHGHRESAPARPEKAGELRQPSMPGRPVVNRGQLRGNAFS